MSSGRAQQESSQIGCPSLPDQDQVRHARLLLLLQYSSRLAPRATRFAWPPPWLLLNIQSFLPADLLGLNESRDEGDNSAQGEDVAYQKSFLKELNSRIEAAIQWAVDRGAERQDWEVESLLLSHYACLMAMPSSSLSSRTTLIRNNPMDNLSAALPYTQHAAPVERHISYYYPLNTFRSHDFYAASLTEDWAQIHLRESSALVGEGTTALKTWEASLRLASHLLCHKEALIAPHARVLELGSGTGMLSVMIAAMQRAAMSGARLCATDLSIIVNDKLRKTFELNGIETSADKHSEVQLLGLDWVELQQNLEESSSERLECGNPMPSTQALIDFGPTLILAADVIFDPSIIGPLVTTIKAALEAGTPSDRQTAPQALIASTVRNVATYSRFLAQLDRAGLASEQVELERYVIESPPSDEAGEAVPPIVIFSSTHDEQREGTVKGLKVTLPSR